MSIGADGVRVLRMIAAVLVFGVTAIRADPVDLNVPPDASDSTKATGVQSVPGVTVRGKTDPLARSDRHLAKIKKSLPGDTKIKPHKSFTERTHDYLAAHSDPNSASGEQRQMMLEAEHAPPEGPRNDGVLPP